MILKSPGSIAFEILGFNVHYYGMIMAMSFFFGILLVLKLADIKKYTKEEKENILDLSTIILVSGVLGARIYFVLFNWNYFQLHLNEVFQVWQGGLSIHGALILGFLSAFIYTRIKKINILKYADIFAPSLALGQSIGRWGNFFNSEAFGLPTNLSIKLFIPANLRPLQYIDFQYFHPTFLYESILDFGLFLLLLNMFLSDKSRKNGKIFLIYLLFYGVIRFFIEGLRIDSIFSLFGFPLAQFVSLVLIFISLIGLYWLNFVKKC
jgi:phosphatidylglycerol---prolipoprotein diacylglyceryl transferase